MIRSAAEVRAAAYHEAGHAVVSWRLGEGIGGVTIEPSPLPDGEPSGGHFLLRKGGNRSMASGWGFRHLVVTLAGPTAQRVHDPGSYVLSCARHDLRSAADFAFVMSASRASARALLTWAHAEARARVAADWPLIEAMATALLIATSLSGDEATALLVAAEYAEAAAAVEVGTALAAAL